MYLFGSLGLLSFLGGSLLSAVTLYQKFFEAVKAHRNPLLLLSIFLFTAGIQFILFGLVAELIVRTYHESQDKPIYILREEPEGRRQESGGRRQENGGRREHPKQLTIKQLTTDKSRKTG